MSDTAPPAASASPPPFSQFLAAQRRGGMHAELTEGFAEVVRACQDEGRAGSITLKVDVRPDASGTVFVSDSVAIKAPRPKPKPQVYFPDEAGGLHRSNPSQPELPLREIPARPDDLREAN